MQALQRHGTGSAAAVAAAAFLAVGVAWLPLATCAKGSSKPSLDDANGLCKAIPALPTSRGPRGIAKMCVAYVDADGQPQANLLSPWVYEYQVMGGVARPGADSVTLLYRAPTSSEGFRKLAAYAHTLSRNSALHLSAAMLGNIRVGKPFSAIAGGEKIDFTRLDPDGAMLVITPTGG